MRSHDELDLGRLTPEQRQKVFDAFGPEKRMQLYDRGIRRRLAPMLGNDRRRLELAFSLLFSLPGTPMMQYGDEIGIGDDLRLPERECARTPMQWTADRHGGFSRARRVVRPVINDKVYGYRRRERCRPASRSAVAAELDGADDPGAEGVPRNQLGQLRRPAHERTGGARDAIRLAQHVTGDVAQLQQREADGASRRSDCPRDELLVEVFDGRHSKAHNDGAHHIELDGLRLALVSCRRRRTTHWIDPIWI